ncbi:MAG: type II secretion system major pseudopilin GspG [Chthoniobacteraceae bacterium]
MKLGISKRNGFTLLEMILVVSIIALLLGVAINKMGGALDFGKEVRVKADFQALNTALKMYNAQNGFYPTTEQGLKALIEAPTTDPRPRQWHAAFDDGKLPRDPWDNEYCYAFPGKHNAKSFDLFSSGPDRLPNTADDLGNWDATPDQK